MHQQLLLDGALESSTTARTLIHPASRYIPRPMIEGLINGEIPASPEEICFKNERPCFFSQVQ